MAETIGRKPKLLVVTSTFPRWENDTDPPFVHELSRRLVREFDVSVHTPHYPGSKTEEVMERMNVHRFRYFLPSCEKLAGSTGILPTLKKNKLYYGLIPFFLVAQFFSLLFLVLKIRPDIIHAHWLIPQGFISVLVKLVTGVPVVVTAHGADIFGLQGTVYKMIKKFTLRRVQRCTVVSKALTEAVVELTPLGYQPDIIPMGVDSKLFSPDKKNKFLKERFAMNGPFLLFVGRLTEKKGVRCLIDSMAMVLLKAPDAKLLIVGHGELEEELTQYVIDSGLDKFIRFGGSVTNTDLPEYYAGADIYIGPSIAVKSGDTEGFGLTFVEAAMSGCLVIASEIGGIGDIIQDNETGFLVAPGDADMLAEKICYAIQFDKKLSDIREESRRRCIEKFDWEVIAGRYAELFRKTI